MTRLSYLLALTLLLSACGESDDTPENNTTANNVAANNVAANNVAANNVAANNVAANNGGSSGQLLSSSLYDGMSQIFSCYKFDVTDGNAIVYTDSIDLWSIKCRSISGTHQITLAIPAPVAGETRDTIADEGEVSFGPIDSANLGKAAGAPSRATITVDTVEMGASIKGSFAADWDGDAMYPAGSCSGTFDVTK